MATLTDYFKSIAYKPKYVIGDRVFGRWNKIPFIGTVGIDNVVNHTQGPQVTILLDLPIRYEDEVKYVIIVKHKQIEKLQKF